MPDKTTKRDNNPLLKMVTSFFNKLTQTPDVYPIKYYKKSKRFRRHWHSPMVK